MKSPDLDAFALQMNGSNGAARLMMDLVLRATRMKCGRFCAGGALSQISLVAYGVEDAAGNCPGSTGEGHRR